MADRSDEARLRAEAKFKRKQQANHEAGKVWAGHAAAEKAGDEKRARLRALRLAKEAVEKDAAPSNPDRTAKTRL